MCVPTEFPTCENISLCSLALDSPSPPLKQHMLQSLQITEMNNSKPWLFSPFRNNIQQVLWCQDRLSSHKASFRQPPLALHPCVASAYENVNGEPNQSIWNHLPIALKTNGPQWVPAQLRGCYKVWLTPNPPFMVLIVKI